ncbi:MAG: hypothetical protein J0I19_08020 [Alphaproteobacteria bacterium]|nr:hypothetical protein [Alphaproteobacteria bacterium]
MKHPLAPMLGALLLGLGGCTGDVKPSPTSDQVIAAQLRARGAHGDMDGREAGAIADAYRQQIAKPAQASRPPMSGPSDSGINP